MNWQDTRDKSPQPKRLLPSSTNWQDTRYKSPQPKRLLPSSTSRPNIRYMRSPPSPARTPLQDSSYKRSHCCRPSHPSTSRPNMQSSRQRQQHPSTSRADRSCSPPLICTCRPHKGRAHTRSAPCSHSVAKFFRWDTTHIHQLQNLAHKGYYIHNRMHTRCLQYKNDFSNSRICHIGNFHNHRSPMPVVVHFDMSCTDQPRTSA